MESTLALAYLTTEFPGKRASQLQVARMCAAFASAGLRVELVRSGLPLDIRNHVEKQFGPVQYRIRTLPGIPFLRNYDPVLPVSLRYFLKQISTRKSPPVVLYGRSPIVLPLSFAIKFKARTNGNVSAKVFCEIHEGLNEDAIPKLKLIDGIVVITRALQSHLLGAGLEDERILVAPDAVELHRYKALHHLDKQILRRDLGLPLDRKLVVFSGHLYEDRGIDLLLRAMKLVSQSAIGVVVGGLPRDVQRVQKVVHDLGLVDRIQLTGYVSPLEVAQYQVCADVLTIPYGSKWRIQRWSSPLKLFEYMASRVPIVSTDFASLREVLLHDENCLMVPPDDAQRLGVAIQRCLDDAELSARLATRAFSDVHEHTWTNRAKRIVQFISQRMRSN